MKDARFTIPTPALLAKVVDLIDHVPMEDRDTKGDLYEYMLGKIACRAERAVSDSASHYSPDGRDGRSQTDRHCDSIQKDAEAKQIENPLNPFPP
jgi:hypothetical protein